MREENRRHIETQVTDERKEVTSLIKTFNSNIVSIPLYVPGTVHMTSRQRSFRERVTVHYRNGALTV